MQGLSLDDSLHVQPQQMATEAVTISDLSRWYTDGSVVVMVEAKGASFRTEFAFLYLGVTFPIPCPVRDIHFAERRRS